jgi:hypothetical protein
MDKRSSKKKEHDFTVNAFRIVQEATHEGDEGQTEIDPEQTTAPETEGKNPNAVALGRLGGKKGGKARAAKLTLEQRREIAKKAAQARWGKL